MARPQKEGLDYFPIDVDMFTEQDDKTYLLDAKYDLSGVGIILKLLQKIYGDKGYYKKWGDREAIIFSKQLHCDINVVNNLINDCINEGFFDSNLYKKYGILTSKGIQVRYLEACKRRKRVNVIREYIIAEISDFKNVVIVNINDINVNINDVNVYIDTHKHELLQHDVYINPQSKVKESNNIYCAFFEEVWSIYPNKKGKGQISDAKKKKLYDIGFEQIKRCIERYKRTKEPWKEWQHGSTFFNSGYVDYLDCNFKDQSEQGKYKDMSEYDPSKE